MKPLFTVSGKVMKGVLIGRKLGFPTINVDYGNQLLRHGHDPLEIDLSTYLLSFGVYSARVYTSHGVYKGALHFGPRRILDIMKPALEVHLLDFSGDLYDQEVKVEIFEKIRDTKNFADFEALKKQIAEDIDVIRSRLNNQEKE